MFFTLFALFITSTLAPISFYMTSRPLLYGRRGWRDLRFIPFLTAIGVGIAISNAKAVGEALLGLRSSFVRTPKTGDRRQKHYRAHLPRLALLELLLGVYCVGSLVVYLHLRQYWIGPFLALYASGFLLVGATSIWQGLSHLRLAKNAGTYLLREPT